MKKILYFIPAILVIALLIFVAFVDGLSFNTDVWLSLALLLIAGIILSIKQWWGCLFGIVVGALIIYSGTKEHGQVINEISVGIILCAYYAIMGYISYKSKIKE